MIPERKVIAQSGTILDTDVKVMGRIPFRPAESFPILDTEVAQMFITQVRQAFDNGRQGFTGCYHDVQIYDGLCRQTRNGGTAHVFYRDSNVVD